MTEITVPRLNSVDDRYVVLEWLVQDGAAVTSGQPVAVLETSKAAAEIDAVADGVLYQRVAVGAECAVGQALAAIHPPTHAPVPTDALAPTDAPVRTDPLAPTDAPASTCAPVPTDPSDLSDAPVPNRALLPAQADTDAALDAAPPFLLTEPARRAAERHGVTRDQLASLGRSTLRESDVTALVQARDAAQPPSDVAPPPVSAAHSPGDAAPLLDGSVRVTLSRNQIAVRAAVEKSHREIPAAYAGVDVQVDAALELARQQSRATRSMTGLTELVVLAVARQRAQFPEMFATPGAGNTLRLPATADIGTTMDTGTTMGTGATMGTGGGLFVPVLRDVESLSLLEVARGLMALRRRTMAGTLGAEDLNGPGIVVALNNSSGVRMALPVVFPGNVACLSLCAPQPALELTPEGQVRAVQQVHLGLAYDHRFVNGLAAGRFLAALRQAIEDPRPLVTGDDPAHPVPIRKGIR